MLHNLLLSASQLAIGLIVVSTITLVGLIIFDSVRKSFSDARNVIAEVRRPGAWQYDNEYFDKIEEFRNDFQ